jgi:hypothetical protein
VTYVRATQPYADRESRLARRASSTEKRYRALLWRLLQLRLARRCAAPRNMFEQAVEDTGRRAMNLSVAQSGSACIVTVKRLVKGDYHELLIIVCRADARRYLA